jgi:hypothetical protein
MASEREPLRGWGYFKRVARMAWTDAWEYLRHRVLWAFAVLGVGAVLGVQVNPLSFAALAAVVALFFGVFLGRAPSGLAREERDISDGRLRAVGEELRVANDRLAAFESEQVPESHRLELQGVAATILGGVQHLGHAYYLEDGQPEELVGAFRQHFGDVASEVAQWNRAVLELEGARDGLRLWVRDAVEARGFDGSPFSAVSSHVVREVEEESPDMQFETLAGHLRAHGELIMDLTLVQESERELKVQGLRDLVRDTAATAQRLEVMAALKALRQLQQPLAQHLKALRAKAVVRGKCALCQ